MTPLFNAAVCVLLCSETDPRSASFLHALIITLHLFTLHAGAKQEKIGPGISESSWEQPIALVVIGIDNLREEMSRSTAAFFVSTC